MASLDSLPPDQRAVLQLVLQRGRSYGEIAQLLSIDSSSVRERALSALAALGPSTRLPSERRAEISDYLLGQLPSAVAERARSRISESASERAWARVVASELAPLASGSLPEIPVEAVMPAEPEAETVVAARATEPEPIPAATEPIPAATEPGPIPAEPEPIPAAIPAAAGAAGAAALAPTEGEQAPIDGAEPAAADGAGPTAPEPEATPPAGPGPEATPPISPGSDAPPPRPSSRRGGAIVLVAGALVALIVVAAVIVIVANSGSSSHKTTSTVAASGTTSTTSSSTTATATPIAQVTLTSPTHAKNTAGIAEVIRQGTKTGIVIVAQGIPANTTHDAYAVWLYNSPSDNVRLGFVNPGVKSDGKLQTAGPLPANASRFHQVLVTLETQAKPPGPGKIVLQGPLSIQ